MSSAILKEAAPFSAEETQRIQADFDRDGYCLIPGVLAPEEVAALREGIDKVFAESRWQDNLYSDFIAVRLFETDPVFEDLLTREPIISLAESLVGADCHLIAQNVVRNAPGQAIDRFHVDDALAFPIGEGMERHDPRLKLPACILSVQIPLTDIPSVEYGPTQFVPGSHYAGRQPNDSLAPTFEGKEPVSILCKPGDIYLQNGQCWHRGAPNASDRTRYLLGVSYGKRWIAQRFYPFVAYQLPAHIVARADARRRRVLGFHSKGAFG